MGIHSVEFKLLSYMLRHYLNFVIWAFHFLYIIYAVRGRVVYFHNQFFGRNGFAIMGHLTLARLLHEKWTYVTSHERSGFSRALTVGFILVSGQNV